ENENIFHFLGGGQHKGHGRDRSKRSRPWPSPPLSSPRETGQESRTLSRQQRLTGMLPCSATTPASRAVMPAKPPVVGCRESAAECALPVLRRGLPGTATTSPWPRAARSVGDPAATPRPPATAPPLACWLSGHGGEPPRKASAPQ